MSGSDVTAVVLTLNEEHNITRCLASLQWCDDIVVIDSASTDRTAALAAELGARVLVHQPEQPYRISRQRNWALDQAGIGTTWVLFVDADEVITAPLQAEILCRLPTTTTEAYQLAPKFMFHGRWMRRSLGFPIWHDRLLRVGRVRLEGGVWEHFSNGVRPEQLAEPYLHYGNSKGMTDWLERHNRYSSWDADGIAAYRQSRDRGAFGTARKTRQRALAARLWPARPVGRFIVMYVLRRGFLDGWAALPFCLRYVFYEYMTVEKVVEHKRLARGKPL